MLRLQHKPPFWPGFSLRFLAPLYLVLLLDLLVDVKRNRSTLPSPSLNDALRSQVESSWAYFQLTFVAIMLAIVIILAIVILIVNIWMISVIFIFAMAVIVSIIVLTFRILFLILLVVVLFFPIIVLFYVKTLED